MTVNRSGDRESIAYPSSKGKDIQVNISSSNKGAKPKMVNKSSNEKPTSDNKSSEAKVKSSKCRFVVLLNTLLSIVRFIHQLMLGLS